MRLRWRRQQRAARLRIFDRELVNDRHGYLDADKACFRLNAE